MALRLILSLAMCFLALAVSTANWQDLAPLFPVNYNGENGIVCEGRDPSTGAIEPMTERIDRYPAGDWTVYPFGFRAHRSGYAYLMAHHVNANTVGTHPAGTNNLPVTDSCINLNAYAVHQIKGKAHNQCSNTGLKLSMYILAGGLKIWEQEVYGGQTFDFDQTIPAGQEHTVSICAASNGDDSVDHAEWIDVQFDAPALAPATVVPIRVKAWIDGIDILHIKYDGTNTVAFWEHVENAKVGLWSSNNDDANEPTLINGYSWYPTWPSGNARVQESSSSVNLGSSVGINLGPQWIQWTLTDWSIGRGELISFVPPLPTTGAWELRIRISDPPGYAAFYETTIAILIASTCASNLPNFCPFPSNVRDTIDFAKTYCLQPDCQSICCQDPPGPNCLTQFPGWKHDSAAILTLTTPDAGDCCQECDKHKADALPCKFWTFHETNKQCTLHNVANLLPAGTGWTCSTFKDPAVPPTQCGDKLDNWRYVGKETIFPNGVPAASWDLCCQLCTETQGCQHWTWKPANGGLCYLHNATADIYDMKNDNHGGSCSYSDPIVDPKVCGALVLYGWIHDSKVLAEREVPDLPTCCDLCKQNPKCHYLSFIPPKSTSTELLPMGVCKLHEHANLEPHRPGSVATYPHPDTLPSQCAPIVNNWKYEGKKIHQMDAPQASSCCAFCAEHPQCTYWTWIPDSQHCYIFSSIESTIQHGGAISGSYTRPQPSSGNHPPRRCEGRWIEVDGTCSMPCGTGKKHETYHVTSPARYGGQNCEASQGVDRWVDCNRKSCGDDCVGKWIGGHKCSKFCGWGTTTLEYAVIRKARNGGHQCEHHNHKVITKPCYVRRCGPGESSLASAGELPTYSRPAPSRLETRPEIELNPPTRP